MTGEEYLPAPRRRSVRVLVVDDYPDTAASMALLLRWDGHEVEIALRGSAALRIAQAQHPDVVLLDISMPEMDGNHVAGELRKMLGDRVRLVAISAYSFEEHRRRSQESGFDHHFVKPADPQKVRELVQEVAASL
jgi:CheY-like chemotaxis protein